MVQDDVKSIDQLNEEVDIAAGYFGGPLDIADHEGGIETGACNDRSIVQIAADDDTDIKRSIGRSNETVDVPQQLTRLAAQQRIGGCSYLIMDVDGLLKRKRRHLCDIALDAIDTMKDSDEPYDLKSVNSFERRVVHDVVREEGLKSHSHGEEPHRYATVYLKNRVEDTAEDDEFGQE